MAQLLLVDDDPIILSLLSRLMQRHGHQVALADSASAALDLALNADFELVISDVMMPEVDGFALARDLRQALGVACPPVLLLTASTSGPDPALAEAAGAAAWAPKTLNSARLAGLVQQLLANRSAPAAAARDLP
jgi:DNA-binding response OmpR family regulator